jgi:hypothetical protein
MFTYYILQNAFPYKIHSYTLYLSFVKETILEITPNSIIKKNMILLKGLYCLATNFYNLFNNAGF